MEKIVATDFIAHYENEENSFYKVINTNNTWVLKPYKVLGASWTEKALNQEYCVRIEDRSEEDLITVILSSAFRDNKKFAKLELSWSELTDMYLLLTVFLKESKQNFSILELKQY